MWAAELRKDGVPGKTYHEKLLQTPGLSKAPTGHLATQFRYDVSKERYKNKDGSIAINSIESAKQDKFVLALNGLKV